jgi:hypothetical protein
LVPTPWWGTPPWPPPPPAGPSWGRDAPAFAPEQTGGRSPAQAAAVERRRGGLPGVMRRRARDGDGRPPMGTSGATRRTAVGAAQNRPTASQ